MIHYGISDNIGIFNLCEIRCTKKDNFTRDRNKVTCEECLKLIPLLDKGVYSGVSNTLPNCVDGK